MYVRGIERPAIPYWHPTTRALSFQLSNVGESRYKSYLELPNGRVTQCYRTGGSRLLNRFAYIHIYFVLYPVTPLFK